MHSLQFVPVKPRLQEVVVVTEGAAEVMITLAVDKAVALVIEVWGAAVVVKVAAELVAVAIDQKKYSNEWLDFQQKKKCLDAYKGSLFQ